MFKNSLEIFFSELSWQFSLSFFLQNLFRSFIPVYKFMTVSITMYLCMLFSGKQEEYSFYNFLNCIFRYWLFFFIFTARSEAQFIWILPQFSILLFFEALLKLFQILSSYSSYTYLLDLEMGCNLKQLFRQHEVYIYHIHSPSIHSCLYSSLPLRCLHIRILHAFIHLFSSFQATF